MQDEDHPQNLELEIARAKRLASSGIDPTTSQRLWSFVDELKQRMKRRLALRRDREAIRTRAYELWVLHGRPAGRDLEFWLQAESEITGNREADSPDSHRNASVPDGE